MCPIRTVTEWLRPRIWPGWRKIWHPKAATLENLQTGIANWENDLEEYARNTGELMDGKTKIAWSCDFEPNGAPEADLVQLFQGIYQGGIKAVEKALS